MTAEGEKCLSLVYICPYMGKDSKSYLFVKFLDTDLGVLFLVPEPGSPRDPGNGVGFMLNSIGA